MIARVAFIVFAGVLVAAPAIASELVPYPVPAARTQAAPELSSAPPAVRAAVPEETYVRFSQETARLPAPDRQALFQKLDHNRRSARDAGDTARELHYFRLLDILQSQGVK